MNKQYMEDAQGRQVPVNLIKDIDILRDQTVRDIMQKTFAMRDTLQKFKQEVWSNIQEFLGLSAEQHGVKFGGKKGNITLTTYDGKYKLLVAVNDTLQFNEKLQVAKQLIDDRNCGYLSIMLSPLISRARFRLNAFWACGAYR